MLYAGLLGARKKVPVWRIGRAQTWMRGHIWLGSLSLPLILFHGGFAFRGPLTAVMMWMFFIVIASGMLGALIQHYIPRMMTSRVPMETIYEEIPHVRAQLCEEADQLVARSVAHRSDVSTLMDIEQEDRARFREVYLAKVRPVSGRIRKPSRWSSPIPAGRPKCSNRCAGYWLLRCIRC